MKQAILAAEDERFYQHGGVDYLSVARAALANLASGHPARRRHHHHAGRAQLLPDPGEDGHPQASRGAARLEDRGQPHQGRDPRALRQPDLPRPARLRLRRRLADLLRQAAARRHASPRPPCSRACPRRRPPSTPSPIHAAPRRASCMSCAECTSLRFLTDAGVQGSTKRAIDRAAGRFATRCRPTPSRVAEMARQVVFDALRRRGLHPRHHASGRRSARPTRKPRTRLFGAACSTTTGATATAGPRLRRTCPAEPAEQEQALDSVFAETPDSDNLVVGGGAARRRQPRSRAVLASGDAGRAHRRRAQVRRARPDATSRRRRSASAAAPSSGCPGTTRAAGRSPSCRRPRPRSSRSRPLDGAILALIGGFDFERNKFNHVTQAQRQPGSASSRSSIRRRSKRASRRRRSSTTRRSSCPATRPAARTGSPRTTTASSTGRCACAPRSRSRRTWCSVRVLQAIGPQYAQDYITRFGFDPEAASRRT